MRLEPLDQRPLKFGPDPEPPTAEQQEAMQNVYEQFAWNWARSEARVLLSLCAHEIHKTGGERQRSEGLQLIRRVQARLREWVN